MTDQERDPEAAAGAPDATDEPPAPADPALDDTSATAAELAAEREAAVEPAPDLEPLDELGAEAAEVEEDLAAAEADVPVVDDEELIEDETVVPAVAAGAAGAATAATGAASRAPKGQAKGPAVVPTVSDRAVHVDDRASAFFVIAVVGLFVAIFGYALLFGSNGLASGLFPKATPTPIGEVSESPAASESASPSESASADASSSASASPAASEAPSAAASASPAASAEPSPSPSAS
jgi:hypothetical protein